MSRTDKDVSWRIQAEWHLPNHSYCQFDVGRPYMYWPEGQLVRECDLPPRPCRGANHPSSFRNSWRRNDYHCTWAPEYYPWDHYRFRYTRPPLRDERHFHWWGPDRARVRDRIREAVQQFRGSGDIDVDVPTQHHRHGPISGGYWD